MKPRPKYIIPQTRGKNGRLRSIPVEQRFYARIKPRKSGCIEWVGSTTNGYGQITLNGRLYGAHVMAMMIIGIKIPKGMCVLHNCDNPSCVNTDHLEIGTHKKNMHDAIARGLWNPKEGWRKMMSKRRIRCGESHLNHKLTLKQVKRIRNLKYKHGLYTKLANQYGVSSETVAAIYRGERWKNGNAILERSREI